MLNDFRQMYIAEVKEEMKNQNIPEETMAIKMNVTPNYMRGIFMGYNGLSIKMAKAMADALDMKPVLCLMEKEEES